MARHKSFEPEKALREAMALFWRQGYAGTSLSDLERTLGIGRKSLYDTFGDKRQLFLRALETYAEEPTPLSAHSSGLPEIEAALRYAPLTDPDYRSCFVANTILEIGVDQDPEVSSRVRGHLENMQRALAAAVSNAIAAGDLPEQNPELTASYLLTALQGLTVMAKGGTSRASLDATVDRILESLRHPA